MEIILYKTIKQKTLKMQDVLIVFEFFAFALALYCAYKGCKQDIESIQTQKKTTIKISNTTK